MNEAASTTVISLVSGKGGSGKTAVSIAMAYLLAHLGFRVAMADADPATHGMTYFFVHRLGPNVEGLCEAPNGSNLQPVQIVQKAEDLDLAFFPSVGDLESVRSAEESYRKLESNLDSFVESVRRNEYDFLLLDCQAGMTSAVSEALRHSQHVIVVTEADPVSVWAVNMLQRQMAKVPGQIVWGLVNKVLRGEEEYYEAIVDIVSHIAYIGQLPFDTDVRRAFFRREVPISLTIPSPFVLILSQAIERLDPRISERLETSKDSRVLEQRTKAATRLDELRGVRERVEDELYSLTARRARVTFQRLLGPMSAAFYAAVGGTLFAFDLIPVWALVLMVSLGALLGVSAAFYQWAVTAQARHPSESEIERRREILREIDRQIIGHELADLSPYFEEKRFER